MRPIEEIYQDLSGVDIREARHNYDERSKGYHGEYLLFEQLYAELSGSCKLLTNLQIPLPDGKSTEIDLLLIHETGVYVFEVKHYKGTIRGSSDDANWVQYFRTAPSHTFLSPVEQNRYHIRALSGMFHQMPMYSFVVFTNSDCQLEIDNHDPWVNICKMDRLKQQLEQRFKYSQTSITAEQIDHIFRSLMPYSPMARETVETDGEELPFFDYVAKLQADYARRVSKNQQEADALRSNYEAQHRALQEKEARLQSDMDRKLARSEETLKLSYSTLKSTLVVVSAVVVILSLLFCGFHYSETNKRVARAEAALAALEKNFRKVEAYNNGAIEMREDLVTVHQVSLTESTSLENSSIFSYIFSCHSNDHGILLLSDSYYMVHYIDGTVDQISYWDTFDPPRTKTYLQKDHLCGDGKSGKPPKVRIFDHLPSDISYIKLCNVYIYNPQTAKALNSNSTFEIELYNAETAASQP